MTPTDPSSGTAAVDLQEGLEVAQDPLDLLGKALHLLGVQV